MTSSFAPGQNDRRTVADLSLSRPLRITVSAPWQKFAIRSAQARSPRPPRRPVASVLRPLPGIPSMTRRGRPWKPVEDITLPPGRTPSIRNVLASKLTILIGCREVWRSGVARANLHLEGAGVTALRTNESFVVGEDGEVGFVADPEVALSRQRVHRVVPGTRRHGASLAQRSTTRCAAVRAGSGQQSGTHRGP